MTGHGAKFAAKEEAITALLVQRNVDEAAEAAGIAPKTLIRCNEGSGVCNRAPRNVRQGLQPSLVE